MKKRTVPKIKFVLNCPRNPKNIGAAARGMANFGFRDMAVVKPYSVAWRETRAAVNAHEVVTKAKKFSTLKKALRSSHLVVGTSAATRRVAEENWVGIEELRSLIQKSIKEGQSVAIVFGSEKSGLSNEDLGFCHKVVRIPTVEGCPSMNLSQAVTVMAYSLRLVEAPVLVREKGPIKISVDHRERLVAQGLEAYTKAGLLKGWDPVRSEQRLRKAIYRWDLNQVDVAMLHGIFRWVITKTGRQKPLKKKI